MAGEDGNPLFIDATDLEDLADRLGSAQKLLAKHQRQGHLRVAQRTAKLARAEALSGTPQQRRHAKAIVPRATQYVARLGIAPRGDVRGANVAFWGALKRLGWNAGWRKGRRTARADLGGELQSPRWVGADWIAGRRGEGPYVINDTIADHLTEIGQWYLDEYDRGLDDLFGGGL